MSKLTGHFNISAAAVQLTIEQIRIQIQLRDKITKIIEMVCLFGLLFARKMKLNVRNSMSSPHQAKSYFFIIFFYLTIGYSTKEKKLGTILWILWRLEARASRSIYKMFAILKCHVYSYSWATTK